VELLASRARNRDPNSNELLSKSLAFGQRLMLLDAATAKALFIIMISTQSIDALKPELPLHVEDRGDMCLIKGTPYDLEHSKYRMTYAFFRKDSAEVTGIMSVARMIPRGGKDYWSKYMSDTDYDRVFGPQTQFEPQGILDFYFAAYGGLINKPADAIDYAYELMQTKPGLAIIHKADLKAEEVDTAKDKVWHVIRHYPDGTDVEVLTFSRKTGKLLSGDL
jgi:hypothetical protein